jgi:hypothetical protein
MSQSLLDEYKAYYRVRAERFANNPNYKHSYEAEQNLSAAMQSCNQLEEFKDKLGNLNEKCANALIKDLYIMRRDFYQEMKEEVRVLGPQRILEKADEMQNAMDLNQMVVEESNKNSVEISMDESHRELLYAWKLLDDIEIYANAEVPSKYKGKMKDIVDGAKESLRKTVERLEENHAEWQQGWKLRPEMIKEHRHLRLFPYKMEDIEEQLQKYKSIINR